MLAATKSALGLLTRTAALSLFACTLLAPVAAQENRATIVGAITDAQGATIPNATIKATNVETNSVTTTTSNESGLYTLPFLPVGAYQISVTAGGMKTAVRAGVELRVGDRIQLDIALEVGQVSETVTINSGAQLLETATASRGQVIDEAKVRDLPLLGRNPFLLAALASGVQITSSQGSISFRPFDNGGMDLISINGGRQRSNEFLIDGQPNTGTENGGIGALPFVPSPDAVQEFKVQSNTYDAQRPGLARQTPPPLRPPLVSSRWRKSMISATSNWRSNWSSDNYHTGSGNDLSGLSRAHAPAATSRYPLNGI